MRPQRHAVMHEGLWTNDRWKAALVVASGQIGQGGIISLIGARGTGKTQMAVELMRLAIDQECCRPDRPIRDDEAMRIPAKELRTERPALYTRAMEMFMAFRDGFREGGVGESAAIRQFTDPRMLVIDEVQERGNTEYEDRMLTHVIDCRYGDRKDTVLVCNLTREQMRESLGASIVSRIQEVGVVIECNWPSFRVKVNACANS